MFKRILAFVIFVITLAANASAQPSATIIFRSFGFEMAQPLAQMGAAADMQCITLSPSDRRPGWGKKERTFCENHPDNVGTDPKITLAWKSKEVKKGEYASMAALSLLFWRTGIKGAKYEPGALTCQTGSDFVDKSGMQGMVTDCLLNERGVTYPLSFFFFYPKNTEGTSQVISVVDWRNGAPATIEQVRRTVRNIAAAVRATEALESVASIN